MDHPDILQMPPVPGSRATGLLMTGQRPPILLRDPARAPALWCSLFVRLLGAPDPLAREIWTAFVRSASYDDVHIALVAARRPTETSIRALLRLLTPGRVLALTRAIEPEGRGPRRQEVMRLENRILAHAEGPTQQK